MATYDFPSSSQTSFRPKACLVIIGAFLAVAIVGVASIFIMRTLSADDSATMANLVPKSATQIENEDPSLSSVKLSDLKITPKPDAPEEPDNVLGKENNQDNEGPVVEDVKESRVFQSLKGTFSVLPGFWKVSILLPILAYIVPFLIGLEPNVHWVWGSVVLGFAFFFALNFALLLTLSHYRLPFVKFLKFIPNWGSLLITFALITRIARVKEIQSLGNASNDSALPPTQSGGQENVEEEVRGVLNDVVKDVIAGSK